MSEVMMGRVIPSSVPAPFQPANIVTNAIKQQVRSLTIVGPDPDALLAAVAVDIEVAPATDVDSDDMAVEMQAMLGRLSTVAAAIESERKQRKAPLLDAGQWLDNGYRPMADKIDGIIRAGKQKLIAYSNAKAEAARKAAAEAAEARRREAEEKARAEAAAIKAAEEAAEKAHALREAGSEQVAQAMETQAMASVDAARQEAAAAAAAIHVAPVNLDTARVKGTSETWKAACTDKALLIVHVGEMILRGNKSLIDLLDVNDKALNALAKLQKQNLNLPGVTPYPEQRQSIKKAAVAA